jgi:hypothetical protein
MRRNRANPARDCYDAARLLDPITRKYMSSVPASIRDAARVLRRERIVD